MDFSENFLCRGGRVIANHPGNDPWGQKGVLADMEIPTTLKVWILLKYEWVTV